MTASTVPPPARSDRHWICAVVAIFANAIAVSILLADPLPCLTPRVVWLLG